MAPKRIVRKPAKKAAKAVSKPAPAAQAGKEPGEEGLLTLTEVSKRSNISMPTLQRYKKLYQSRIPSVGKGRKQRYLESSLAIFEQLKNENIGRRGRPKKAVGKVGRPVGRPPGRPVGRPPGRPVGRPSGPLAVATAVEAAPARRGRKPNASGLMTLTQISKLAGVSYPTAVRYVRLFLDRLPHEGEGRRRRFYSGAVEAFNQLREEGGRGGQRVKRIAGRAVEAIESGVSDRIKQLEKAQQNFEKKLRTLAQSLQKFLE